MRRLRPFFALIIAILCAALLFFYLSGTLLVWRIVLSGTTFACAYLLTDGFFRFD